MTQNGVCPPAAATYNKLVSPPVVSRARTVAFAALILTYFLYFSWDRLPVHFSSDDMMNMAYHWSLPPVRLLLAQFAIWQGVHRPMAGLFYTSLFGLFGLNPVPFHAVIALFELGVVCLMYRLATLLRCGSAVAVLVAFVASYHVGLVDLFYNIAYCYDVLCCFFYLSALTYYIRIRQAGGSPRGHQWGLLAALYVCALNSKEMAVTLPVIVLAYEWCYHRAQFRLRGPITSGILIAAALNLVFIYGAVFGSQGLTHESGYQPVFSLGRIVAFQRTSLADLLFLDRTLGWKAILALWVILFVLAWKRADPALRFCWLMMVVTPLPIEFLEGRGRACLYIPLAAWAIFASTLVVRLVGVVRPPVIRHTLLAVCLLLWADYNRFNKIHYVKPAMADLGRQTWEVIGQIRALHPRARPHSLVVFLDDPFPAWDMLFIARLWFRDRTVRIELQSKMPLAAAELAQADSVFTFESGRLVQVK